MLLAKKRVKCPGDEETTCPVCNGRIVGTPEELAEHVDLCLQEVRLCCLVNSRVKHSDN